jgi:hypothetical protein
MSHIIEFLISAYDIPYQEKGDEVLKEKYSIKDLEKIISLAEKDNLSCLSLISLGSKTYFNESQCLEIKKNELPQLRKYENINKNLLNNINKIIELVLQEGYSFLKFEPIKN